MSEKKSFGARLKHLLKDSKTSQEAIAGLLGRHKNTISQWVRDERQPSMEDLRLISNYLDVDYSYLFTGETAVEYALRKETKEQIINEPRAKYGQDRKEILESIAGHLSKLDDDSLKIVQQLISKMGGGE